MSFDHVELVSCWLLDLLMNEEGDRVEKIGTVLWGIWFARNKKIWNDKDIAPDIAMNVRFKMMSEWQEANKRKKLTRTVGIQALPSNQIQWTAPESGKYKVNVDASVYSAATSFTLGMIIRNDQGQFLAGKTMRISGRISVMEAEARGVREAISWVEEQGIQQVVIECDAEMVVAALHGKTSYLLEVGHVIEDCREKLKQRVDLSVCHIKKQANRAAHLLAKVPCLLDSCKCFLSPPVCLLEMAPTEFSS